MPSIGDAPVLPVVALSAALSFVLYNYVKGRRPRRKCQPPPADEYAKNWDRLLAEPRARRPIAKLPAGRAVGEYLEKLEVDGCVIIQGAVPVAQVRAFREEHGRVLDLVGPAMEELRGNPQDSGELFYKGDAFVQGMRVRKNAEGRFELTSVDSRDGGPLAKDHTRLAELADPLVCPSCVRDILEGAMPMPWRMNSCGTLPTYPGAEAGAWHRDINLMFGNEALDLSLPDFYYNLLVPLDEVSADNGTEILLGSHKLVQERVPECPSGAVEASPGDVVIFNGKVVHRGRPNAGPRAKDRSLLFVVFAARWFEQGRRSFEHDWLSSKCYDD